MPTYSAQIVTFDFGASLSNVTVRHELTDALLSTAGSCAEVSTDAGVYVAIFTTGITPGVLYRLRAVVDGAPINRYVVFGADGTTVPTSDDRAAVLASGGGGGGSGDATLANQTTMLTILNEIANQTDLITGPGEDQVTIEIRDNSVGVDDVSVWITSDSGGVSVVAGSSTTNGSGQVTFLLTAGTSYYLWASKTGKISIQGRLFTAVAD